LEGKRWRGKGKKLPRSDRVEELSKSTLAQICLLIAVTEKGLYRKPVHHKGGEENITHTEFLKRGKKSDRTEHLYVSRY